MVAIETEHADCVQELVISGVKLNLADADGNNVYHYAAKCADPRPIQVRNNESQYPASKINL